MLASAVRAREDALCPGRCRVAWSALAALRRRESSSRRLAARRQSEYANHEPHLPTLSELLLMRWRAGDWSVVPEDLLAEIKGSCASHE
jgi:hypothetical protein